MDLAISEQSVREAAERIKPLARRTPVMTSRSVDARAGMRVFLKCENLQRGGAFKIRGATNLILSIPAGDLRRGVVAFSSGNHAQAVAIAAKHVGAHATIVMPEDAPRSKMEPTRELGAQIVTYDRFREDREAIAAKITQETGGTVVPPYDHPMIMAGQGTAALEILEDYPDLDALVVCVGGGGLLSGSATIAKAMRPGIRVFGVEPELANDVYQSVAKGERVSIPPPDTIADGLRTPSPGKFAFPVIQKLVESILLVSEDEIRATMRFLMERVKIVVEPSGAVAVAAILFGKLPPGIGSAAAVISGGNVDLDFLKTL
ncbi:MAG TPA: threonine/serine dehydratase [Bryobacteraceae bacterium]|nr:threonine/serine dehydratase [Bryobacteraceae bacterium]